MRLAEASSPPNTAVVLHVVLSLSPGGTERLVIELAKRTRATVAGVVCLDEKGAWAAELAARGVPVFALGRRPGFRPALGVDIARIARRLGATILHCHHYTPFVYGRVAALAMPNLRLVFTEHGRLSDAPPSRKRRLVNPLLSHFRGTIHAVSHDLKQHMVASGFPENRIEVIHNGIDPGARVAPADVHDARSRLGIPPEGLLLGTVARFDPVKDLATFFRAAAMLGARWPFARLVVVGDGPEHDALHALSRELNIEDKVMFLGYRDDARGLLPSLDIYINSSISEGISLTLLEAMAASCPIVATRVGGTPEVVDHEVTGLMVPARSPGDLAKSLERLLCSPPLRRSMGDAGRLRMERFFSIDRMVARYDDIYERAAAL